MTPPANEYRVTDKMDLEEAMERLRAFVARRPSYPDYAVIAHESNADMIRMGHLRALASSVRPEALPRVSGARVAMMLKQQRDKLADVVREVRTRMQAVHSSGRLGQEISDKDCAWLAVVDAALADVPTYEQQLHRICDGIGITREELGAILSPRGTGKP